MLTASVAGLNPGGTVVFKRGTTEIGTATINGGQATLAWKAAVGTYSLTASYSGDANNSASTSAAITVLIKFNPALLPIVLDILE